MCIPALLRAIRIAKEFFAKPLEGQFPPLCREPKGAI